MKNWSTAGEWTLLAKFNVIKVLGKDIELVVFTNCTFLILIMVAAWRLIIRASFMSNSYSSKKNMYSICKKIITMQYQNNNYKPFKTNVMFMHAVTLDSIMQWPRASRENRWSSKGLFPNFGRGIKEIFECYLYFSSSEFIKNEFFLMILQAVKTD